MTKSKPALTKDDYQGLAALGNQVVEVLDGLQASVACFLGMPDAGPQRPIAQVRPEHRHQVAKCAALLDEAGLCIDAHRSYVIAWEPPMP